MTALALVRSEPATKGQPFACPGCGDPLVFRAGEVRARHFAHRATGICTSETVLHATAKRLVAESVARFGGRDEVRRR
jgi:competence CoiA-like predicted nuclease